jgi:type I restriction enzyme S subunit
VKTPTVQVGELALNETGAFKIGPFGSSLKKSELVESGIPVVGIENVLPNKFVKGFRRFISPQKFEELSDYEVLPDDVLVTTMGTIGRAASAPRDIGRVIFDSHLFRMRVNTRRVFPPYLCYALNSDLVASQLSRMARGAIMEGLNTTILRECSLPLPEISEQQRVAERLERADRLVRTRSYALELTDTFLAEAFLKFFGNPVTNAMEWEICALEELGDLDRGRSKHRPRNAPELLGGPYPLIQTGDVANSGGYIRTYKQTYSELGLEQSKIWPKNTLCITIAANIAKTGILMFDACFPDSVVGFTPNGKTNTEYVQLWFSFVQQHLERIAPESAQKNINLEILRGLRVPLPPLKLQAEFAAVVQKFEHLRAIQREALRQAEHLFVSLLYHAFSG